MHWVPLRVPKDFCCPPKIGRHLVGDRLRLIVHSSLALTNWPISVCDDWWSVRKGKKCVFLCLLFSLSMWSSRDWSQLNTHFLLPIFFSTFFIAAFVSVFNFYNHFCFLPYRWAADWSVRVFVVISFTFFGILFLLSSVIS